ncbi:hypothetical protein HZF02_13210 [Pseudomonas yamanorum]|nr:hypothetical protein HZF02_13210 [Pseudomonas yamanorum]
MDTLSFDVQTGLSVGNPVRLLFRYLTISLADADHVMNRFSTQVFQQTLSGYVGSNDFRRVVIKLMVDHTGAPMKI